MSISQLFIFAALAFLVGRLKKGRSLALLGVSAFIIYWLQAPQEDVTLTFWFPTATLVVTVLAWLLTSTPDVRGWKQNFPAVAVLVAVVILVDLNRYFKLDQILNTATPRIQWLGALIIILLVFAFLITRFKEYPPVFFIIAAIGLMLLFVLVKMPSGLNLLFEMVSAFRGKAAGGLTAFSWLGFSYVAFRLLHTILDRKAGRLSPVPLAEYVDYVIFFPSFTAGPIDRLEHFTHDLKEPVTLDRQGWMEAGSRFFLGIDRKSVV